MTKILSEAREYYNKKEAVLLAMVEYDNYKTDNETAKFDEFMRTLDREGFTIKRKEHPVRRGKCSLT